jgi:alanyl-tRNA synthetase
VLNTGTAELVSGVENLAQTNRQMKKEIDELKNQLISIKAAKLLESPDKVIVVEHVDSGELRKLSQGMMNQVKSLKILAAEIDGNSCFAIISPDNQARVLMDAVKQKLEVTGGGSPKIVSGQTAAPFSEVLDVLQQLG